MRRLLILAVALSSLVAAASGASAGELVIPAPTKGFPSVLAAGESGATLVVWSTDDVYQGYGPLSIDTILSGPASKRRRWSTRNALLADHARDRSNDLDLLVRRGRAGENGFESVPRLALYRARQDGRVRRTWSGPRGIHGVVARRGSTVVVMWVELRKRVPFLRMATSTRGRPFTRPRTVKGVLPSFLREDLSFINDLDLTLDANAHPVVALTAWHRPAPMLVIAELTRAGRVRTRQITRNVDGLVQAATTTGGRIAVMVDDTGIEGERGECVGDGNGRRLWATVRGRHATRFAPVRQLDAHPFDCAGGGARLVTNVGERIWFLWTSSAAGETDRRVKAVLSHPGHSFSAPITIAQDAMLRTATAGAGGGVLDVVLAQIKDEFNPYGGPIVHLWINAGGINPAEPVEPAGAGLVLADRNPDDTFTLLAWQRLRERALRLQGYGGP